MVGLGMRGYGYMTTKCVDALMCKIETWESVLNPDVGWHFTQSRVS